MPRADEKGRTEGGNRRDVHGVRHCGIGRDVYGALFAEPRFSADNAAGIAVLASLSQEA